MRPVSVASSSGAALTPRDSARRPFLGTRALSRQSAESRVMSQKRHLNGVVTKLPLACRARSKINDRGQRMSRHVSQFLTSAFFLAAALLLANGDVGAQSSGHVLDEAKL